jgi:hypothetical protein
MNAQAHLQEDSAHQQQQQHCRQQIRKQMVCLLMER